MSKPEPYPDEVFIEFGNEKVDAIVWVNRTDGIFPSYTRTASIAPSITVQELEAIFTEVWAEKAQESLNAGQCLSAKEIVSILAIAAVKAKGV